MGSLKNEIGNKYGLLTVIERAGTKQGYATWKCKCQGGKIVEVKGVNLRREGTKKHSYSFVWKRRQERNGIRKEKF